MDIAWLEWSGLTKRQRTGNQSAGEGAKASWLGGPSEDDEDDDPAGQYDEDAYTGPQPRGGGPGCPISDPDIGIEDQPCDPEGDASTSLLPRYGLDQSKGPLPPGVPA
jgi:hypothetical protein